MNLKKFKNWNLYCYNINKLEKQNVNAIYDLIIWDLLIPNYEMSYKNGILKTFNK